MLPFLAAIRRVFSVCLPISAVLAVGISPGAQAQAPPGPLGWVPLPRPLVVNPQPGPDYDWTGFQNSLTLTPFNFVGPPAKQITTTYGGGAEGSTSGGNYMMEYPYAGTGGSGNTLAEANATINGAATYKWQWTPPNNAAGQPDIVKFPVPPLYTLADVYAMAWTRLPNGTSAVGLAVKMGNLSDGLPDNWTASMQSVPQQIGDTLPHRGVLPTTLDRVKPLTYDVALSPAGSLDVTGKQTVPQGGYNGPGATCISAISVTAPAFPVTLFLPDPFVRPDLGDGKNQFVYDATTPTGLLSLPVTISVTGASADDTAWLMRGNYQLGQQITIQDNLPPGPGGLWDHTICSAVPTDQIVGKHGTLSVPLDGLLSPGLPPDNTTLGNHVLTLMVNTNPSEIAHFQTFFLGMGKDGNNQTVYPANHPIDNLHPLTGGSAIPNWYYYYNLVYPATGNYDAAAAVSYTEHNGTVHIANDIVNSRYPPHNAIVATALQNVQYTWDEPVFVLVDPTDTKQATYVRLAGYLTVPGVLDYIFTCAHEQGHRTADLDLDHSIMFVNPSTDLDGVSDDWENHHHMNSSWPDTTALKKGGLGAYGVAGNNGQINGGDIPDEELVADTSGDVSEVFANLAKYNQDWADGGMQHGKPYYLQPDPITNTAPNGFYLWFTPAIGGDASILGPPYHVKSLDDIRTQHPDFAKYPKMQIITSWAQLFNANPL